MYLLKICTQSNTPLQKIADFDRFRLIVPQPWQLAKKVQLSLIGSWQCAFQRAIDEPSALHLSPPKGGSKREFLHFALPFISSLQVIIDTSDLVCRLIIASLTLWTMDDKLSLKWAWSCHVIHFKFQVPKYSSGITEARIVKLLTQVGSRLYLMLPKGRHITS